MTGFRGLTIKLSTTGFKRNHFMSRLSKLTAPPAIVIANLALVFFAACFFYQQPAFITSDLGRHLKNGEIILASHRVPQTNTYSYTNADFPTITHHWSTGIIFYLIFRQFDFAGLALFNLAILTGAFAICLLLAHRIHPELSLPIGFLSLPLYVTRTEIRPEAASYLFFSIFLFILSSVQSKKLSVKWLYFLPLLSLLWVNLHIYFILGICLVGLFWLQAFWTKSKLTRALTHTLVACSLISLINPFGLRGLLAPFTIFNNYDFPIGENQTIFTILRVIPNPRYDQSEALAFFSFAAVIVWLGRRGLRRANWHLVLLVVFAAASLWMVRHVAIFGLVFLVSGTWIVSELVNFYLKKPNKLLLLANLLCLILIALFLLVPGSYYSPWTQKSGLKLTPEVTGIGNYLITNNVAGPIFNDFDIGSYLDYYLYPKERVFVDNRPEAYPPGFFRDILMPALTEEFAWQDLDNQYRFNAIVLSTETKSPVTLNFITRRRVDPDWKVAYENTLGIIFKNTSANSPLIRAVE